MVDDIPDTVVAAQRASTQAWAALETYHKQVDADRRAAAVPATERHRSPELRPWTPEENSEYERLHMAAVEAATVRRQTMQDAGVTSTWETERQMRAAARGEAE
jgi:hypothetical protein